ncbi:outer membrane beta-barrel protein [Parabacteroides sp. Marseille-P3160]|uniref:outer membrane beta-barrel protein n=1 Tax=Parabacteroides sp. Marseille-P3160 TaxID=1917887 RepID=UPI0009BA4FBA|nr:outer membrane beta-barrel protein [Parabacteroides sp. Marseille-P3160]
MKKIFIVFSLVMIAFGASAQKQGLSSIGLSMGYGFDTENATLGIDYRYSITDEFRFAPSLTHYVKKDGLSAWSIDMNAHYVVLLSNQFAFYPIGGLSLSFWDFKWNDNTTYTRFGANIGLGGEVYATPELTVGLDLKYHIIKDFDQALFAVRVAYNF